MSNSLAKVHPELVSEWSERNFPLTPDNITYGSNKRVWWKGSCGHEWQASVKARSKGEGCPICSGARVVEGINDLATVKPKLSLEWSEKNTIKPTEVTAGSHKKVIWKCEHGHEWTATVKSRTINKTGCPYCSHNKVLAGFNDLASQYPDIAAEWSDRNLPLLPTMVTAFANSKAWWKCKDCGNEWHTLISTRAGGSRCPYCSGYTFVWHTTGSGKTMTSFKSAQLIASSKDADKVIFLMDRIELGTQSLKEYRGFADENESVQATENTGVLITKIFQIVHFIPPRYGQESHAKQTACLAFGCYS